MRIGVRDARSLHHGRVLPRVECDYGHHHDFAVRRSDQPRAAPELDLDPVPALVHGPRYADLDRRRDRGRHHRATLPFFVHKAAKKYEFGCTPPPAPTAAQLRNVVDRDGVHVSAGDEIEVKYCNTWHRATLVTLRGDQGTWSVRVGDCKHTRLGCWYGAQRLRQVGAARPDEEAAAVAAAENRKQAKRIEELEAHVKSLTEWQKKQERGRGRKQSPRQDQVVPVATAAAVVAFPEATPIPPPPGVAPVGYDGGAWGDGGNRVVPGTVVIAL